MEGMSGMGHTGHDMSGMTMSGGIFTSTDETIARGFWYGVAGSIALLGLARAVSSLQTRQKLRAHRRDPASIPSRPPGWLSQAYATATAILRELTYPQPVYFTGIISKYFSPLPLGRWLLLTFYWIVILCFLWSNTILKPDDALYAYKWEIVGFRAAWVTVTQIPLAYLLSCKFNPITIITGISYERFNWLHRWVARTICLTALVHWSNFYAEWTFYNMVTLQFDMMPMVKYGFGAWGIITWMVLSGFGFFRDLNYELFVIQHIVAAAVLLWALFIHVPFYARYNIWLAVSFVAFDWGARLLWAIVRNLRLSRRLTSSTLGYPAYVEELPGNAVRLTIENPGFSWTAGQHVYIAIPSLRPFELHPFTIANVTGALQSDTRTQLRILLRAQSGFTKRLLNAAKKQSRLTYRTFLSGPWGNPPNLLPFDTVLLIACSTGASFTVPILQNIVEKRGCLRTVVLHWIIRSESHLSWYKEELEALIGGTQSSSLTLQIKVHVTGEGVATQSDTPSESAPILPETSSAKENSLTSINSAEQEKRPWVTHQHEPNQICRSYSGRPTLDSLIRPAVEAAVGETAVVVCGGTSVTADSRTCVATLSDERAVHKGTGAQGIFLFTETYGW